MNAKLPARWIITGCNGYLGGEICRLLHGEGNIVVGVSRSDHNIAPLTAQGISCVTYEQLPDMLKPSDCFVHCAGKTGFSGKWEEFEKVSS